MAEEINEPKNIQGKPQATESVKHVHLERKRPKLSKFDDENSMNRKKEKAPPLHMLTEATTSPQKNMRAELLFFMRGKKRHSAENFQIPKTPQ